MRLPPKITRDISYAHSASSKGGRALIRVLENVTGRYSLIRRAQGYEHLKRRDNAVASAMGI